VIDIMEKLSLIFHTGKKKKKKIRVLLEWSDYCLCKGNLFFREFSSYWNPNV